MVVFLYRVLFKQHGLRRTPVWGAGWGPDPPNRVDVIMVALAFPAIRDSYRNTTKLKAAYGGGWELVVHLHE